MKIGDIHIVYIFIYNIIHETSLSSMGTGICKVGRVE